jgi:hypothetical protein
VIFKILGIIEALKIDKRYSQNVKTVKLIIDPIRKKIKSLLVFQAGKNARVQHDNSTGT